MFFKYAILHYPPSLQHSSVFSQHGSVVVTGTLGLSYPTTALALRKAVKAAKGVGATVLIDVNWRPVFWEDGAAAKRVIMEYLQVRRQTEGGEVADAVSL